MKQWYLIETSEDYEKAMLRFEEVRGAQKGNEAHREKMLLVTLIEDYEKKHTDFPELDPIEFIKIRMEDFGYQQSDLAEAYGDKGTVSKVFNYKQPLSLNMIRIFSKKLRIPPASLIREYNLAG
jgi:HTH-type transcriptional regulator/antitoxin HigA